MTEEGRRRVSARASDLTRMARAWQRTHEWPTDPDYFGREVQPLLFGAPAHVLAEATGLSIAYCRRVQRGVVVPHPMWWEAFETAASKDGT